MAGFLWADMRWLVTIYTLAFVAPLLVSCAGSAPESVTPDETGDLEVTTASVHSTTIPEGIEDARWRWVEAHCTEGPLDLLARGYAATLRAHVREGGLDLLVDQQFATESCQHTVLTRAVPPDGGLDWQVEEITRVAVPSTRECLGRQEDPRPGTVRIRDGRLEVLVQRSHWCNGLEVRMVYERDPATILGEDEIVRRYVAHFTRGDADALAALFAQTGSLLEPFTQTETGDPYRHDGRPAVLSWFTQTFATAPWRAMRVREIETGAASGGSAHRVLRFEYMDPRLEEPLVGVTRFTIAAGEIFEAQIELSGEPQLRDLDAPAEPEPAAEEATTET